MMTIEGFSSDDSQESNKLDEFSSVKSDLSNLKNEVLKRSSEPRPIEHLGANKVLIPFDWNEGNKNISIDFTVIRNANNSLTISVSDNNDSRIIGYYSKTVPILTDQQYQNVILEILEIHLGVNILEKVKQKMLVKVNQSKQLMFNSNVDQYFVESDYIEYGNDKFTYGKTLKFYQLYIQPKVEQGKFEFGNIPSSEHFSVILNSVIDYNQSIHDTWHPEQSDDFFRPKQLEFYQDYVDQVSTSYAENKIKAKKVGTPNREKEIIVPVDGLDSKVEYISFSSKLDQLITHGRNGLMKVGRKPKQKIENYNYMKAKLFHRKIGKINDPYNYVKDQISKSKRLPKFMKDLILCIPMEESAFRNKKTRGRTDANYFWQFMESTGEEYDLKINNFKDERKDLVKSTKSAIRYFEDLYTDIQTDSNFKTIVKQMNLKGDNLELVTSFFAINAYNSGYGHMQRAFDAIVHPEKYDVPKNTHNPKKSLESFINKYGDLGLIFYITNEYPKHYKVYQRAGTYKGVNFYNKKYKYHIESPSYGYKILKYYMLNNPIST